MDQGAFYRRLIEAYKNKTATDKELEVLMHLLREGKIDAYLIESMEEDSVSEDLEPAVIPVRRRSWIRRALPYAAACIILLSTTILIYTNESLPQENSGTIASVSDIPPGKNYATLTLGNGTVIPLDQTNEGEIVRQSGLVIRKTADARLVYETAAMPEDGFNNMASNTISTPKGGQYQVVLSDGTKVWLNAASTLRYPIRFNGSVRQVELVGEGYFEVSADKNTPFIVNCHHQIVHVTGTRFNINAYQEEQSVKTTLLEGKVTVVSNDGKTAIDLRPGEQSLLANEKLIVKPVDAELATDWKNGDFIFDDEDIRSIMRRIARWYDVDIVYAKDYLPQMGFFGHVSRSKNLSEVLQVLELTGAVRFRIEGRTVTVLPPP